LPPCRIASADVDVTPAARAFDGLPMAIAQTAAEAISARRTWLVRADFMRVVPLEDMGEVQGYLFLV
jgi:hypothetical protein